jgi:hypothetical protein
MVGSLEPWAYRTLAATLHLAHLAVANNGVVMTFETVISLASNGQEV